MNVKHAGGVPKKHPTVADLEASIESYFETCDDQGRPYTVEGLSYHLDIHRATLLDYQKDEADPARRHVVERAKRRILQSLMERSLMGSGSQAITIFNLKNNYGYTDRVESDSTVQVVGITGMKISSE